MDINLLTEAAYECMSPDQMDAFEALFADADLARRYVNCVRKRLTVAQPDERAAFLDVVFDGPPSHESGRFVEVEDEQGRSFNAGEWIDRGNGLWALRIGRATEPQPDHYQGLIAVAYVVLGCLAANGVDIPERFLDAFSDPDSVENPLELLPCDFSPAQAVRAAVEVAALTDEQRESIREAAQCLAYAVTMTQDGYDDGETGPASEWDAAAQRLSGELNALLAAPKEEL